MEEMGYRLVNSVTLLGIAMVAEFMVGIPLGIFAASKRGTKLDVATVGVGLFTRGVPTFFIQLLALLLFSYYACLWFGFPIFPPSGPVSLPPPTDPLAFMADRAWHLALPVLTLIVAGFGGTALYIRNIMVDTLTEDYVLTARAKGLGERTVLYKYAFRGTLPPVVTMITAGIAGLVTGAMITEYLFSYPGIGRWYLDALNAHDYPVVQSVLFVYTVLMLIMHLVADLLYGFVDPRIRVGHRR